MENPYIRDESEIKMLVSPDYNFLFNKESGAFIRWGKTLEDDPLYSPFGPEIADIEISTICHGVNDEVCRFCYKGNTPKGENMSFETFKAVFANLPKTVGQIAFGIGDLEGNPDLKKIFEYSREHGVIPNVTINGDSLTEGWAQWLTNTCGAVAVSCYDYEITCNAVDMLTRAGLKQVNIHFMLSDETLKKAMHLIYLLEMEPRLAKLNALVFLGLKLKGRAKETFTPLSQERFTLLVNLALSRNVPIGFDSCSAFKFLNALSEEQYTKYINYVEPCESTCFSSYINVQGKFFPCSFMEGEPGWEEGIDAVNCKNFLDDVWNCPKTCNFRDQVIKTKESKRSCAHYEI